MKNKKKWTMKKNKVNKPTFMVEQENKVNEEEERRAVNKEKSKENKVNKPTLMVEQETPLLCNWSAFSSIFFMLSHLKVWKYDFYLSEIVSYC